MSFRAWKTVSMVLCFVAFAGLMACRFNRVDRPIQTGWSHEETLEAHALVLNALRKIQ